MFESLLDSLPCGAAWLDRDSVLRYCNRPLEGFIGRPRSEIVGGDLHAVFGPELAIELTPLAQQALGGETASRLVRLTGGHHGRQRVMMRLRPRRDDQGAVTAVLLSVERRNEEHTAEQTQAQHGIEEVQRVAKIGTYRTDLVAGTWTASEGFCRIFGFEPGGVYSQEEFQAIVHPGDLDMVMAEFGACLTGRKPFDFEYRCITRHTGQVIHVRSTSQIFWNEAGQPDHIIGIKQDISERKELERQLVASQRMEAIGQLAGGIAHDFNNMLAAIMGFTELSKMTMPRDAPSHDHLEQVLASADRAKGLVQQLLSFSKRRIVEPTVVDLNETIGGVDKLLRRLLGEHIDLDTQLTGDLGEVRVDPGAIEQVIVNLAVNARDAMPLGGKLTIESYNATLDAPASGGPGEAIDPGRYVVVAVSDDGCGMDLLTQQQIFEPFFTTKDEGKGTGLGLATCFGLITQAGGRIAVYSEVDHGSTFKVYLPRVKGEVDERPAPQTDAAVGGTERVLLVEDDEAVRTLAATMLTKLGYRVLIASDAGAAIQLMNQSTGPIHLLLTDVVIPGRSGTELAREVQDHSPRTRVLYMSGYNTNAIVHRGELDQGVTLLQKPFSFDELGRKVRQVLDG